MDSMIRRIHHCMSGYQNPENVKKYQRFFSGNFQSYGLSQEDFYSCLYKFQEEFQNLETIDDQIAIIEELIKSEMYESGSLAFHLTSKIMHESDFYLFNRFSEWFDYGFSNWALTDGFCHFVLSPLLTSKKIEPGYLSSWINAASPFKRRAVPVSFVKLLPIESDPRPLFEIIRPMLNHKEKPVQQGCGWFLRDSYVYFPEETIAFLEPQKNQCGGVLLSYVREKMPENVKIRFMKRK